MPKLDKSDAALRNFDILMSMFGLGIFDFIVLEDSWARRLD